MPLPYKHIDRWSDLFDSATFLAAGAYGAVNKTYSKELSCSVAVKVLKKKQILSVRKWKNIVREIEIHESVMHENAVRMLGPKVVQTRSDVFIIMELADQDLFERIVTRGPMPEETAGSLTYQLVSLLVDLHSKGIVHRDIKPENLLLCYRGGQTYLKVADFGFAKVISSPLYRAAQRKVAAEGTPFVASGDAPPNRRYTAHIAQSFCAEQASNDSAGRASDVSSQPRARLGVVSSSKEGRQSPSDLLACTPCGTYGFAAPELIESKNRASGQHALLKHSHLSGLDVFAAGVVLHIMLTGCEPFPCKSTAFHLRAVSKGLKRSHPLYRNLSCSVMDLMGTMMCYDPTHRPAAAAVFEDSWLRKHSAKPSTGKLSLDPRGTSQDPLLPGHGSNKHYGTNGTSASKPVGVKPTQQASGENGFMSLHERGRIEKSPLPSLTVSQKGHVVLYDKPDPEVERLDPAPTLQGVSRAQLECESSYNADARSDDECVSYPAFGMADEVMS